ncbi:MAG: LamG domain-containing protein [Myxococcales bacterium]|nr:LamG domain-containing protein [Myxococcales bacterium]
MIHTLAFTATSHPIKLPAINGGLGRGMIFKVWVRRSGSGGRQRILNFVTSAGAHVVLGSGDREDSLAIGVEIGTERTEVVAMGAMPLNRWVRVTAKIMDNGGGSGSATLSVFDIELAEGPTGMPGSGAFTECSIAGGDEGQPFVGSLANLEIWRYPLPSLNSLTPAPVLIGSYPLDAVTYAKTVTTTTGDIKYYSVNDTSSRNNDGLVEGELGTLEFASLEPGPIPVVELPGAWCLVDLSPLPGLAGKLTLETWCKPNSMLQRQNILTLGDEGAVRLALTVGGDSSAPEFSLLLCNGSTVLTLLEAPAEKAGSFQHVAVTLAQGARTPTNLFPVVITMYVNGQLRTTRTLPTKTEFVPLIRLLNSAVVPMVRLSGGSASGAFFAGQLSELRIWNVCRSASEIGFRFLARLVGNDAGLLACYRMEQRVDKSILDISPSHGLGRAPKDDGSIVRTADGTILPKDFTIGTATNLPLLHTSDLTDPYINMKGKLVSEYLVYKMPNAVYEIEGQVEVFDATLQPVRPDGHSVAGKTVQVMPDADVWVYLEQEDNLYMLTQWKALTTYSVTVPLSGEIRLRFKASTLSFPTLRVRFDDMARGIWSMIRPDTEALHSLARTSPASLLTPPQGKVSPLPAGSTMETATICAETLSSFGDSFRPATSTTTGFRTRGIWGKLGKAWKKTTNWAEDAASTVENTVQKAGASAGQFAEALVDDGKTVLTQGVSSIKPAAALICFDEDDLSDLMHAASGAVPRYGRVQISEAIASASRLAVISTAAVGEVAHSISVIGTTIINGVTYAWRTVAVGVMNAIHAMTEFLKKIGAAIHQVIDFLAWLFSWKDFLAASDGIYDNISGALDQVPTMMQGLSKYKAQILSSLTVPTDLPKKSLSELCGISIPDNLGAKEMNYVMELGHKLMSSANLDLDGLTSFADGLQLPSFDTAKLEALVSAVGNVATPVIRSATGLLTTPVSELVSGVNSATEAVLDFVFEAAGALADVFVTALRKILIGRIKVPRLSAWIEKTILGGRPLNLLRIVALVGGIFEVLLTKIAASATAGEAKPQAVSFADDGGGTETKTGLLISNFVISCLGSLLQGLRLYKEAGWAKTPVAENRPDPNALARFGFDGLSGVMLMLRSSISITANEKLPEAVKAAMDAQAACEGVAGGAMIVWGFGKWTLSNGKNPKWLLGVKLLDVVVQLGFGVGAITAAAVAGSHKNQFPNQLAYSSYGLQAASYLLVQFTLLMNAAVDLFPSASTMLARQASFVLQLAALSCDLGAAVTSYSSNQAASSA